jgi:DNA-binding HxlR family transcriptional regulator
MKQSRFFENPTDCPVVHTMSIIGGELRFGKLALFIPTISRKILTEQLRELEKYGLIKREEFNEVLPKVEYSLTELGKSLIPVITAMCSWGQNEGRTIETKQKLPATSKA